MKRVFALTLLLIYCIGGIAAQQTKSSAWRSATEAELAAIIPARAPVIAERIETELRTASGITDGNGRFIAGVVLITAGYSADGKYSHYFIVQVPIKVGELRLPAGQYIIGWTHKDEDTLTVNFYEAVSGKQLGSVNAVRNSSITRIESFRIWPPADHSVIQIGRFTVAYQLG